MIDIAVTNRQHLLTIDADQLTQACKRILAGDGHASAAISLTVVDDDEMHSLNREHLDHDYPTDVLSFPLSDPGEKLVGEVVVSSGTAIANGQEYGNRPEDELLLYVVHGMLHLIGLNDKTPEEARKMRHAEAYWLAELGVDSERIPPLVYLDGHEPRDQSAPEGEPTR